MSQIRDYWIQKITQVWKKSPIAWLAGVRRTGKTTLAQTIPNSEYFNCDLPSVQIQISDPEYFLKQRSKKILIFDEIHQLENPTSVLKIISDTMPKVRVLATGSSTLVASQKFKDTLTGRKRNILFPPVLVSELNQFKCSIDKRMLFGGLPPALLSERLDNEFYGEWLDSFYARDIQELYHIEKRQPFLKALEWLLVHNSSLLDVTKLSQVSGVTRPTMTKYLDALETTRAISIIRPFFLNPDREIISQPKIYGFDTGFVCYTKGIVNLQNEDRGEFLENLVLETIQATSGLNPMYWRDKQGHEIDFVLKMERDSVTAIECKWKERQFDPKNLEIFRKHYPKGKNILISSDSQNQIKKLAQLSVESISIECWQDWCERNLSA